MVRKILLEGQEVLTELDWFVEEGARADLAEKRLRTQALRRSVRGVRLMGVAIPREGVGCSLGTYAMRAKEMRRTNAPSLLALTSRLVTPVHPVVFVIDVGDGGYWVAGFLKGLPTPGSDRILSQEAATDFIHQIADVHGDLERHECDGYLENGLKTLHRKVWATATPGQISSISTKLLIAVLAMALLAIGGNVGFKHWRDMQAKQRQLRASEEAAAAAASAQEQANQAASGQIRQMLLAKVSGVSPKARLEQWLQAVGQEGIFMVRNGRQVWQLKSVACDLTGCQFAYQRRPGGRLASLIDAKPAADGQLSALDAATAMVAVPEVSAPSAEAVIGGLVSFDKGERVETITALQSMLEAWNVKGSFSAIEPLMMQPKDGKPVRIGFDAGTIALESGTGAADGGTLRNAVLTIAALQIAPSIDLTQLHLDFNEGRISSWKVNGNVLFRQP